MKSFAVRRIRNGTAMVLALSVVAAWVELERRALGRPAFTTGYLLLAAILLLACYNIRKKLPQLPLGTSAGWLQLHIYTAVGTLALFALHMGLRWPTGVLESLLAGFYLLTVASGLVGIYLTRTIPAQLTRVGEEIIYERIPAFRQDLCAQARAVVLEAVSTTATTTVADFYTARLYDFFERPRGWNYHLRPTSRRRRLLLQEMQDLRRYLADSEHAIFERLFSLVRKKDDLDFHAARQGLLKSWLFIHIALTYGLLLLAMLHGLAAHVYWGGAV